MIGRKLNLTLSLWILILMFSNCPAQESLPPPSPPDAPANNLAVSLRAAETDKQRQTLIDAQSKSDLIAACALLAEENLSAHNAGKYDLVAANAGLIKKIADATADADCRANSLLETALALNDKGEDPFAALREALALFESTGNKKKQAHVLSVLYYIYRARADYEKALEYGTRAVKIHEEIKDYKQVVEFMNGIGAVSMFQGNFDAAEKAHRRALQISEQEKYTQGISGSAFHLGIIYRARGNYSDALRFYQQARLILEAGIEENPELYKPALSSCLRHIGLVYYLQGSNSLALEFYYKTLAIDESFKDKNAIAYSLLYIARVRFVENDYRQTLALTERALTLYRETGDREGTALALNLLGYTSQKLGSFDSALEYFRQSLSIREATGSRDGAAVVQTGMASVYQSMKKHPEAIDLAQKAAAQFEKSGNRELLWQTATIAGKSLRALGEREKALANFLKATATIEDLRRDATGSENERGIFFASKVEPFQQTALIYAETGNFSEAFAASERAKARVLLDVLKFGRVEQSARLTDAEHEEENRLRNEIASLNAQLARLDSGKTIDAKRAADLQARLEKTRLAYADFQACAFAAHPELKLQRGAIEPVSAKDAASMLDEKTALLEYLVAENETLLFVFTKNAGETALKIYKIPIRRSELLQKVSDFRQKLATGNLLFSGDARALYDLLLKPAEAQLKNKSSLAIVPDDGLWELPFQALQAAENRYVLDDAAISYAPGVTILRELSARKNPDAPPRKTLLAFGNPLAAGGANIKIHYAALPEAERMVFGLRDLYGSRQSSIFTRAEAREDTFKKEAGQYRIVHLATHGFLDNANPFASYVLLAPNPPDAPAEDGKLEAGELLEMNLSADLVTLSACETARGQARAGEGMIGLAWSLLIAGTRSVAVSQWKVESAGTTELMQNFYTALKPDLPADKNSSAGKAEALRRGALKLRRNPRYAHPFYWAGFVLIGEA